MAATLATSQIIARSVIGSLLLVGGLIVAVYVLEGDLLPIVMEARASGNELRISFSMMLKGVAPLAVALVGLRLIKSGLHSVAGDD